MKLFSLQHQRAFTLMELIVSIAIISMMLFLINRIFFDTTKAVSLGIATSKIISNTRTVGEQLADDFEAMKGPDSVASSDAGFLIIVNNIYEYTPYLDGRDDNGVIEGDRATVGGRSVRSDQICFIQSSTSTSTLTQTDSTKNSYVGSVSTNYSRLWYGHIRQFPESGNPTHDLGDDATPDAYATNWVLGRQQLFLDETPPGDTYAKFTDTNWKDAKFNIDFYLAQTDVLNKQLRNTLTPFGILDELETEITWSGYSAALLTDKFYVFNTSSKRLSARTIPTIAQLTTTSIAQMHPYFMNNVSDFIVEFAGDYDGSGKIDLDGSNIKWYGLGVALPNAIGEPFGQLSTDDPRTITKPYIDTNTATKRVVIFNHKDTTYWPKLLRIRYRLHDPKGRLLGIDVDAAGVVKDDGEPGKWFEVIVKVQ
ncbi:MAG: prepilin-type N-terminal cleavage/methylation domain-containing protein [Phycisphaeraceae bacterium]|nr:prepilin-type N-terminal cleavage/methylation domain-containing protein [Phycisphaeraceae bacterium]